MTKRKKYFIYPTIVILLILNGCTFNENTNPSSPDLLTGILPQSPSPANNSSDELLVVDLKWESSADKFDVYFDKNNPPQILLAKDTTAKKLLVTGLEYSTKYYWKVIAKTNSGTTLEGPVWSFTTVSQDQSALNGFVLIDYGLTISPPSNVNVLLQVVDLNGSGVVNLTEGDFEVYEDGEPVSVSESKLTIKKRDQLPYNIYTVLMLDNSTSLKDSIDAIRSSASEFVNNLLPNQRIAVYSFSESQYLLQNFTSDTTALKNALNNYQLGFATTDLYGSVIKGASLWKDSFTSDSISQGFMIIFTDGKDTQGSHTIAEALNSISNKIVFTIGLGSEIDPDVLERIGNAGFYRINNTNELSRRFTDIQNKILNYANSFYMLTYQSPKRGNKNHTLAVKIKNNPYSGAGSVLEGTFNSAVFSSN